MLFFSLSIGLLPKKARAAFKRISKSGSARVVLVWNERLLQSAFEKAYEDFILTYAIDYQAVNHTQIKAEQVAAFDHPSQAQ